MTRRKLVDKILRAKKVGILRPQLKIRGKSDGELREIVSTLREKDRALTKRISRKIQAGLDKGSLEFDIGLKARGNILNVLKAMTSVKKGRLHPILVHGDVNYTLSRRSLIRLIKGLKGKEPSEILLNQVNFQNSTDSDDEVLLNFSGLRGRQNKDIKIVFKDLIKTGSATNRVVGAFFPYNHRLDFDLSILQIYNNSLDKFSSRYNDCCFIHALKKSKVLTDVEITAIKMMVKDNRIPFNLIKDICTKLNFGIVLRRVRNDGDLKVTRYNVKSERLVELCLVEDHYFLNTPINLTSYAITHYDEVKDLKRWNRISKKKINGKYTREKNKTLLSLDVVRLLMKTKDLLEPLLDDERLLDTPMFKKFEHNYLDLDYLDCNVEEDVKVKKAKFGGKVKSVVFFDIESSTDGDKHVPYMLCSKTGKMEKTFIGDDLITRFLESLDEDSICYAHNLGYDVRFIIPKLDHVKSIIQKSSSKIISVKGGFHGKDLEFKCTQAMINTALRKFPKMFNLESKKEIMPYELYTRENVMKESVLVSEALEHLKSEEDKEEMMDNLEKWGLVDGLEFDHIRYAEIYCQQDVKIMARGFKTFRGWFKKQLKIDIVEKLTMASVSDSYLRERGCYEGTYKCSGLVRDFIQRCVVGGRTMCYRNEKMCVKKDLNDFDAVGLYASAMVRLGEKSGGFLKGKPKVLKPEELNYDFLQRQDGYFVMINVLDVKKELDFPILNKMNGESGVREFSNDHRGNIFVSKITLEDLIRFQGVEFEVLSGYYYNEGRNNKIGAVMRYLFERRVELKNERDPVTGEKKPNPAQVVYKESMNSSYGKTILKPITDEVRILDDEQFDTYLRRNYSFINNYVKLPGGKFTKVKSNKPILDHFNLCVVGEEILAMSKRIMHEVMCLAQDIGIKIYYQDTDSMHIENDKIKKLSDAFRDLYQRELIGKGMGQFHSDFSFDVNPDEGTEIISKKSIFLGKKSYIDECEIIVDGEKVYRYHMRMKGIPHSSLNKMIESRFNGEPLKMYKYLYDGNDLEFNLLEGCVKFEAMSNYDIRSRGEFKRSVIF